MQTIPNSIDSFLRDPYQVTREQIDFYDTHRYIKLKEVLSPDVISFYSDVISEKVDEFKSVSKSLEERDTYGKAFLQLFNLWLEDDKINQLILSKRLGKIASDLMQTNGVRLYHDQALFKEAGGGITPWHADQYYWPLETDRTITLWMPLQATPLDMGPLEFSAGSHRIVEGRDLEIGDESEVVIQQKLRVTDFKHVIEPFDLGEVSFHSGWIFHRAGANQSGNMRKVMTIIYMDKNMVLKDPENENQKKDWKKWCPGSKIGEIINSPINPVIYSK